MISICIWRPTLPTLHTQQPISLEAHRISQNQGLVFLKGTATEGNDKTHNSYHPMFYGRLLLYFRIISEMVYNVHFLCYVLYNQVLLPSIKYAEWLYDTIETAC